MSCHSGKTVITHCPVVMLLRLYGVKSFRCLGFSGNAIYCSRSTIWLEKLVWETPTNAQVQIQVLVQYGYGYGYGYKDTTFFEKPRIRYIKNTEIN